MNTWRTGRPYVTAHFPIRLQPCAENRAAPLRVSGLTSRSAPAGRPRRAGSPPSPGPDPAITPRPPFLAYSGRTRNMDVYIRARPVARSEAWFPPPHQEPGTGARPCPRGPGFLAAPGHRASSGACPRHRRPTASRTTQRTARRRPGPARSQRRTRPRPAFFTGGPSWPRWPGPPSRRWARPIIQRKNND